MKSPFVFPLSLATQLTKLFPVTTQLFTAPFLFGSSPWLPAGTLHSTVLAGFDRAKHVTSTLQPSENGIKPFWCRFLTLAKHVEFINSKQMWRNAAQQLFHISSSSLQVKTWVLRLIKPSCFNMFRPLPSWKPFPPLSCRQQKALLLNCSVMKSPNLNVNDQVILPQLKELESPPKYSTQIFWSSWNSVAIL